MIGEYGPNTDCTLCLLTRTIERQGKAVKQYLMVRNNRGINAGLYNFPGGKLDKDELLEECVKREVWEETGIKIKSCKMCGKFDIYFSEPIENSFMHPDRCRVFIYQCNEFEGKLRNPLLKEGQKVPEVKAFWCDENKIPFQNMRDNDVYWFNLYQKYQYVANPSFIREKDKLSKIIPPKSIEEAKKENEIRDFELMTIAKHKLLAEREGLC